MIGPQTRAVKNIGGQVLIILLTLALAGLSGCGYKSMPVPPDQVVPKPITDLRYELDQHGVTLRWTYPAENLQGDELAGMVTFKLSRAVVPADSYCETCPIPFGQPITIDGGAIIPGKGKQGEHRASLLRPGHLYFFKVRSAMGWLSESEESNIVSFMWNTPPAAPQNMDANAADSNIILRWEPVSKHVDGSAISESVKYQVFRNSGDGAFNPIGQLVSESQFVDTQVTNGKAYQYKVQAVTVYEKGQVGGGVSELVEAIPMDQTPPPVPEGVQGIRTTRGVKVLWNRVKSTDVGGYRIYRRLPDELTLVKVGEVGVISTIFDDNTVPAADSWYYSVTSIDKAQPPNESEPSAEVKVRN